MALANGFCRRCSLGFVRQFSEGRGLDPPHPGALGSLCASPAAVVRPSGLAPCCSEKVVRGSRVPAHRRCGIQHPSMPPGNYRKFQDCSEPQKTPSSLAYPPEAVFIPGADLKADTVPVPDAISVAERKASDRSLVTMRNCPPAHAQSLRTAPGEHGCRLRRQGSLRDCKEWSDPPYHEG